MSSSLTPPRAQQLPEQCWHSATVTSLGSPTLHLPNLPPCIILCTNCLITYDMKLMVCDWCPVHRSRPARLIMREDKSLRLLLNANLWQNMSVHRMDDKVLLSSVILCYLSNSSLLFAACGCKRAGTTMRPGFCCRIAGI